MADLEHDDRREKLEAFPELPHVPGNANNSSNTATSTSPQKVGRRSRGVSLASSVAESLVNSAPPLGFFHAAGQASSKIVPPLDVRKSSRTSDGPPGPEQTEDSGHEHRRSVNSPEMRRRSGSTRLSTDRPRTKSVRASGEKTRDGTMYTRDLTRVGADGSGQDTARSQPYSSPAAVSHTPLSMQATRSRVNTDSTTVKMLDTTSAGPDETGTYANGYRFPAKHTWTQSIKVAAKAFWKFFITPLGFLVTIYALNVVGWGAMIFFALIPPAVPALCQPGGCNGDYSQRRIWVEIDAQVLNALFCVTGFGLLPWRLRDFYYLMKWRVRKNVDAHRRLAGIYRGWYRLPDSDRLPADLIPPPAETKSRKDTPVQSDDEKDLAYAVEDIEALKKNPAVPLPVSALPPPPLTGVRAPPTKSWNLDAVIWLYILNSAFQVVLATYMWTFNRFTRPAWATGLFVTLGCLTGIFAGVIVAKQGKKVKKVEGVPFQKGDVEESVEEYQARKQKEDKKARKHQSRHHKAEGTPV